MSTDDVGSDRLRVERQGEVVTWTLDAPPANEIGQAMLRALEGALDALDAAPPRVLVIQSAREEAFSAGADLRELHRLLESHLEGGGSIAEAQAEVAVFIDRIHALMDRLDSVPWVTIAAISGVCMGGGFELALTCDIRLAVEF